MHVGEVNQSDSVDLTFDRQSTAQNLLPANKELHRKILRQLLGHPQRYSQLRTLTRGRSDNLLTSALRTLQKDALLTQVSHRGGHPASEWALTSFGVSVALHVYHLRRVVDHEKLGDALRHHIEHLVDQWVEERTLTRTQRREPIATTPSAFELDRPATVAYGNKKYAEVELTLPTYGR